MSVTTLEAGEGERARRRRRRGGTSGGREKRGAMFELALRREEGRGEREGRLERGGVGVRGRDWR